MDFIFYKFAYLDPAICLLYWVPVYAMTYYVISCLSSQMSVLYIAISCKTDNLLTVRL